VEVTNALAYYNPATVTVRKKFYSTNVQFERKLALLKMWFAIVVQFPQNFAILQFFFQR
jgi:hypothetical protein